jgi:hypothetical protein
LENEEFTPIFTELIAKSAAPLADVEVDFAIDSTGFSTSKLIDGSMRNGESNVLKQF